MRPVSTLSEDRISASDDYTKLFEGKLQNPYPFYDRLRAVDPVHWSERFGCWLLTSYADVTMALRDARLSANRTGVFMKQLPEGMVHRLQPLRDHLATWMSHSDPPDHTRLRGLVSKAFTPGMVEGMRSHVQEIVDELLDAIREKDEIDIIRDIAYPLPAAVISDMLGVPPDGREQFRQWAEDVMAFTGGGALALPMIAERAQKSLFEMYDYFGSLIRKRRNHPENDLISALTRIEEQGDKLTEEDLLGLCDQLLTAGHDTTRNLIGNGMLALLENEDQLQKLTKDPSLIASAVEELLRFDSPLQRQTRVAKEDFELHGHLICKGQPILSMLGAANRDPSRFEGPNRLDICRRNNGHVAFGSGIHYCLGAPLSRLEGHIAFNSIAQRFPTIRLANSVPKWRENMSVRGLISLTCTV
jgi:pimeloyl-[acyl-carrier protein] synthase